MNIRRLKSKLINFSSGKVCLALLLVYTFMCGSDLNYATSKDMSVLEYVLYTLTDHYYMIYAWLFFLIFFSAHQVKEKSLIERLRYNTLREFYFLERLAKAIQIAGVIVIHAVIPFIIGVTKLEFSNAFTTLLSEQMFDSNLDVITAYAECFETPISAIICVLIYWTIGSVFISEMIYYCSEIWQKKGMLICIMLVLTSTMSGFMTDIDEHIFEFLFLNNYYILHHVLLNIGIIPMIKNVFIMIIGIIMLEKTAISRSSNKFTGKKGIFKVLFVVRPMVYILFFSVLVLLGIIAGGKDEYSVIWGIVKGFSYEGFQLTEFLYYIAPILFVLFFVNAAWEKEANCRNELFMFRIGGRKKWNKIMEMSCIRFLIKSCVTYLGMMVIVLLGCIIALDTKSNEWLQEMIEYYGTTDNQILYSILIALLIRILELFLLYGIDRVVYVLTNNSIVSYIITFVLYIPGIVLGKMYIFILGRGSAYQILELFAVKREFVIPVIIVINIGLIWILNFVSRNKNLIIRKETSLCQR